MDYVFKLDQEFFNKITEARKVVKEYLKNRSKIPPITFERGVFVIDFD